MEPALKIRAEKALARAQCQGGDAVCGACGFYNCAIREPLPRTNSHHSTNNAIRQHHPRLTYMTNEPDAALLKPIFGIRADGRFQIEQLLSLKLEPKPNSGSQTFFEIYDNIITGQPAYVNTVQAALGQSIVPIVALSADGTTMKCLGTGFFISADGLLLTAAHVISDPIEREYGAPHRLADGSWTLGELQLGVLIATNPILEGRGWAFQPILWASFLANETDSPFPGGKSELKLTSDTAICRIGIGSGQVCQPLSMIQRGIQGIGLLPGKRAMCIGYSGMTDLTINPKTRTIEDPKPFRLHVSLGNVIEQYPDNGVDRTVRTPGACFSASLTLPPGMSGSPIFDDEMIYTHGVASSGLEDESGPTNFGFGSMIKFSLGIPIKFLDNMTLQDILNSSASGIVNLSIPDA